MATVFKKPGRRYLQVAWYDHTGKRHEKSAGTTDKRLAERIAAKIQNEVAMRDEGFVDSKMDALAAAGRCPISEHLDDFIANARTGGIAERHCSLLRFRVSRIIKLTKAETIADLTGSVVMGAIAEIRKTDGVRVGKRKGRASQKTAAYYLRDCKHFCRWMVKDGRAADNALAYLTISKGTENRRLRRVLASDELTLLIAHVEASDPILGLPGKDRAMFYRLLAGTGFRVSEAASLTPGSFDLDADTPTVTIEAAYSKHRRQDIQPIRFDLAEQLRPWLKGRPVNVPVFNLPDKPYKMFKRDLDAAKTAWAAAAATIDEQVERQKSDTLEYQDKAGRYADLHSLRHTYISTLANAGVPVKAVQELARHCDPRLTLGVYTHARMHDIAGALDALPSLKPESPQRQAIVATGTDDATAQREDRQRHRQRTAARRTDHACERAKESADLTFKETGNRPANLRVFAGECEGMQERARRDSNPQPTDPKSVALSNWATGALRSVSIIQSFLQKVHGAVRRLLDAYPLRFAATPLARFGKWLHNSGPGSRKRRLEAAPSPVAPSLRPGRLEQ